MKRLFAATVLLLGAAVSLLWSHAVDNRLSDEDLQLLPRLLAQVEPLPAGAAYAEQIAFIDAVQVAVLAAAPGDEGLPLNGPREPKDLLRAGSGLCYDRSRTIEKALRYADFETRHLSLFAMAEADSALDALLTPGVSSHAITEVLTEGGWLIVDSNHRWLALDRSGRPVPLDVIARAARGEATIDWRSPPPADIYTRPFVSVIGLYSRHGRFYPPYDPIPDLHWGELLQNFAARGT